MRIVLCFLFFSGGLMAKDQVYYFNQFMGHVHTNPSRYSSSVTTISCGHPFKLKLDENRSWQKVKIIQKEGHVMTDFLSAKRPKCFQSKYSRFLSKLNLDLSELYFFGRLSDLYIQNETKAGN